jgi:hypothetical protein
LPLVNTVINAYCFKGKDNYYGQKLFWIESSGIYDLPRRKGDTMKSKKVRKPDYGCDSRCVSEYVECIDKEDGASICKTRERNCLGECTL